MKLQLIHTDNYLVAVDDSEIKEGDWCINTKRIGEKIYFPDKLIGKADYTAKVLIGSSWKKITHHLPLNNAPVLDGIELLPPLEVDLDDLARENANEIWLPEDHSEFTGHFMGFKQGYNKAKEDYKYTKEDLRIAIQQAFLSGAERLEDFEKVEKMVIENIQGLQPKLPTAFDTETKQYIYE